MHRHFCVDNCQHVAGISITGHIEKQELFRPTGGRSQMEPIDAHAEAFDRMSTVNVKPVIDMDMMNNMLFYSF